VTAPRQPCVLSSADGGIGRITLNRPEALNAITVELGAQFGAALRDLGSRADVHVILVRGAGGNFSAGGDCVRAAPKR
jgi:enoyl-CoA hydratase/carnithine racemase